MGFKLGLVCEIIAPLYDHILFPHSHQLVVIQWSDYLTNQAEFKAHELLDYSVYSELQSTIKLFSEFKWINVKIKGNDDELFCKYSM